MADPVSNTTEPSRATSHLLDEDSPELQLERDIAVWHDREIADGNVVPDFWDDCDTSFRLGVFLASLGYKR